MAAVPAKSYIQLVVQDNRGFKANVKLVGFVADISSSPTTIAAFEALVAAVGAAVQAATNAKVVSTGFGFDFFLAQEPSTETGVYQLVVEKAHLLFGSGNIEKEQLSIPAPKDAMFLTTTQDNLIVVNPASSIVTNLQAATSAALSTPDGGAWGAQFFGGQLRSAKPRRRRVLQGA